MHPAPFDAEVHHAFMDRLRRMADYIGRRISLAHHGHDQ